jgi:hypothetical protein
MFDEQESDEFRLPAELAATERKLASLMIAPLRVDRDRLMFEAGRAATTRGEERGARSELTQRRWFWPAATAMMTAATVMLAAMLVRHSDWRGDEAKPQAVDVAASTNNSVERSPTNDVGNADGVAKYPAIWMWMDRTPPGYLGIRYVALTRGVDALAHEFCEAREDAGESSPPIDARQLLQELLPKTKHKSI